MFTTGVDPNNRNQHPLRLTTHPNFQKMEVQMTFSGQASETHSEHRALPTSRVCAPTKMVCAPNQNVAKTHPKSLEGEEKRTLVEKNTKAWVVAPCYSPPPKHSPPLSFLAFRGRSPLVSLSYPPQYHHHGHCTNLLRLAAPPPGALLLPRCPKAAPLSASAPDGG
jgi:hypothetical protein